MTAESVDGTMQQNAKAIGEVKTLGWLVNMDYEDFIGELKHATES